MLRLCNITKNYITAGSEVPALRGVDIGFRKSEFVSVLGPSGCGKGTVLKEVLKNPDLYFSVSATTRDPRPGEVDGVNYRFMTNEAFEALIEQDGFLEYAGYCDHYYGSPKQPVEEQLAMGKSVILEIEVEGAMKVRAARPDAVFVFILPPSMTELENRLRGRGTEAEEVVQKRVAQAKREIGFAEKYDYVVINDDLSAAIADVNAILCAESHKTKKNLEEIKEVLGK